jgi:multidrug efflux pump subunit AcrB
MFIVEEAGQLYSDVAIAISASILASMLVAITLIPTASARLEFGNTDGERGETFARTRERVVGAVERMVASPRRRLTTIGVTVLLSLAIIVLLTPAAEYLPEGEEPKIFARMNAPPGYNLETMAEIAEDVQAYFMPFVGADPDAYDKGETDVPPLRYLNVGVDPGGMRIISEPIDRDHINQLMDVVTEKYRTYPGMRAFAARGSIITSNDGGTRSINLDISGPNLTVIYDAALAAFRRSEEVFGNPRIQTSPLGAHRRNRHGCGRRRLRRRGTDRRRVRRRILPGGRQD